ncbi:hypothetical protein HJG60_009744 [Phyllostomus discolor]|uniref:Uncharacterized protein n=1 Tax=Phyllostomus discolor TaxID=89673 RepID=A0A834B390_9CHIR|nr:hypothetical protein HJG60_009744 [Phyllostomus discolor]
MGEKGKERGGVRSRDREEDRRDRGQQEAPALAAAGRARERRGGVRRGSGQRAAGRGEPRLQPPVSWTHSSYKLGTARCLRGGCECVCECECEGVSGLGAAAATRTAPGARLLRASAGCSRGPGAAAGWLTRSPRLQSSVPALIS